MGKLGPHCWSGDTTTLKRAGCSIENPSPRLVETMCENYRLTIALPDDNTLLA